MSAIRLDAHGPQFLRKMPPQLPVRVATTAAITIATGLNSGDTIDGVTLVTGDRVLVKDQATASQNGIYEVGVTPERSFDFREGLAAYGAVVVVVAGAANGGTMWRCTNVTVPTIDTTALTFTEVIGDGSGGGEGSSSALFPTSAITSTKNASNPTFNFASIPENIIKVDDTYWAVWMDDFSDVTPQFHLSSATDRDGPWTSYAGNPIYSESDIPWNAGSTQPYAPFLLQDGNTFYLFYSVCNLSTGANGEIGVATASAVTGPYTDHGSAILARGTSGAWDSLRVGEPAVLVHDGTWFMAYMGEDTDFGFGDSERVGIATASSATGTWTKSGSNPILDWGAGGQWDDDLIADPHIWFDNGYYWMMYAGGTSADGLLKQGLAYALDPLSAWTRHASNPILVPGAGGQWDDNFTWRGCLFLEDGLYSGLYGGYSGSITKGGNFRLNITAGGSSFGTPAIVLGTAAAAGAASTVIRSDATIVAFDTTDPTTLDFGDVADEGVAAVAARRDHVHGMPSEPTGIGPILISDTPSTPLVFADLIQNEDQDDLVYADT